MTGSRMAGRRVLIAGGSTGIGRATAQMIVDEGGRVAVIGRHADTVDACAAATGGEGLVADMCDEAQARRAVNEAAERLGGLDGLVNCVGKSDFRRFEDMTLDVWNEGFLGNVTAHFLSCHAALPHLRAAKGSAIVNISALAGITPGVTGAGYSAAKAAVIQFTQNLAAQLAPDIRANIVSPGAVATQRMMDNFISKRTDKELDVFLGRYAVKRLAEPEEIAAVIVFLLSHDASYITGSNYIADGGRAYR